MLLQVCDRFVFTVFAEFAILDFRLLNFCETVDFKFSQAVDAALLMSFQVCERLVFMVFAVVESAVFAASNFC